MPSSVISSKILGLESILQGSIAIHRHIDPLDRLGKVSPRLNSVSTTCIVCWLGSVPVWHSIYSSEKRGSWLRNSFHQIAWRQVYREITWLMASGGALPTVGIATLCKWLYKSANCRTWLWAVLLHSLCLSSASRFLPQVPFLTPSQQTEIGTFKPNNTPCCLCCYGGDVHHGNRKQIPWRLVPE